MPTAKMVLEILNLSIYPPRNRLLLHDLILADLIKLSNSRRRRFGGRDLLALDDRRTSNMPQQV